MTGERELFYFNCILVLYMWHRLYSYVLGKEKICVVQVIQPTLNIYPYPKTSSYRKILQLQSQSACLWQQVKPEKPPR